MIFLLLIALAFLMLKIQEELIPSREPEVSTASCPSCETEIEFDWLVCPHCLQRLRENCPICQRRKLINHSFCTSCGNQSLGCGA